MPDVNAQLSTYLTAQYVATWPSGKDLNVMMTRRVTVTDTAGEMTARVQAAIVAAR